MPITKQLFSKYCKMYRPERHMTHATVFCTHKHTQLYFLMLDQRQIAVKSLIVCVEISIASNSPNEN